MELREQSASEANIGTFFTLAFLTSYILEQSVEQRVRVIIDELKKLDRTYFGKDRVKQMKSKLD